MVVEFGLDEEGADGVVDVAVVIGAFDGAGVDTMGFGALGVSFSCLTEAAGAGSSEVAFTAAGVGAVFDSATGAEVGVNAGAGTGDGTDVGRAFETGVTGVSVEAGLEGATLSLIPFCIQTGLPAIPGSRDTFGTTPFSPASHADAAEPGVVDFVSGKMSAWKSK